MTCWTAVVGIISDSSVRVVHSGIVAIDRMVTAYLAAVNARAADQQEGLQAVLSHFAWAGAIRLRSAGAHVLDRTSRMPAALQVRTILFVQMLILEAACSVLRACSLQASPQIKTCSVGSTAPRIATYCSMGPWCLSTAIRISG
jgi:hypothetical protein